MLRRLGLGSRLLSSRHLLPVQGDEWFFITCAMIAFHECYIILKLWYSAENLSISGSELFSRAHATESSAQQQVVSGIGKISTGSSVLLRDSRDIAIVIRLKNTRWYGSVSPGADLAQRILSADDPENLGGIVSYLATLPAAVRLFWYGCTHRTGWCNFD